MGHIPIAKVGWPLILGALGFTAFLAFLSFVTTHPKGWALLAGLCLVISLMIAWFFRDPERTPNKNNVQNPILSPADGHIADITEKESWRRIGIFLSIFDCHVQRAPLEARVTDIEKKDGRFLAAFNPRASTENASTTITLENPTLGTTKVRQIVGLLARRIVTQAQEGDLLKTGDRLGMIIMGSRVELDLPKDKIHLKVQVGDRVYAGKTLLGSYNIKER